jgi:uncharacterized protein YjaG (DUF416 family)
MMLGKKIFYFYTTKKIKASTNMVAYKKINPFRLMLLKAGFFLMLLAIILLLKSGLQNGFYFCMVLMLFLSFYNPKDFIISDNRIEVIHYFFFSLIFVRKAYLKTDNTIIKARGTYFDQEGDPGQIADDTGTGIGCILSIFSMFSVPTIVKRTFSFSKIENDKTYVSDIGLNIDEFVKLSEWIKTSKASYIMDYTEFSNLFKMQIFQMAFEKQLNFGILISKKLYPDYQKFSEEEKWGSSDVVADAIALCEKSRDVEIDLVEFELMIQKIEEITPHMDDFGNEDGSCALNACVAIHATLRFLATEGKYSIEDAGIAYYDTQDARLWDSNFTDTELDQHPSIIEARNFLLSEVSK